MVMINIDSITISAHKGLLFPIKAISSVLNGNMEEIEELELKGRILQFLKRNEKVFVSDIVDYFEIDSEKALEILEELEEEGKIKRLN